MSIPLLKTDLPFSHIEHANQLIHALNTAPWFESVGAGALHGFDRAASWEEALLLADYSDEYPYGDYLQDLSNDVRALAARTNQDIYNKLWGKAHDTIKKPLGKFLDLDVFKLIPSKKLSPYVMSGVTGALINFIVLGLVYGLNHENLNAHVDVFLQGYFPCGYRGEYPDGKLVVY